MYSIVFSSLAKKQFNKLNAEMQDRVVAVMKRCRIRPYSYVRKIVDSPHYRLRAGNYRIIVDIKNNKLEIIIIEIDHRKRIYK